MTDAALDPLIDLAEVPLGDLLSYGTKVFPDKIALADRRTALTFQELEALALNFSYQLSVVCGIGPGDRVMILAHKTCQIPALAIAIWKLGAIYMPVDADLPFDRLAGLVARARPKLVVHFGPVLALPAPMMDLDQDRIADRPTWWTMPAWRHGPDDIAYVIHTSGSTGVPKGVQISERSLKSYFRAHNAMLRFTPQSRVFSLSPFHFDVSIEDTLLPLALGAYVFQYSGVPQGGLMRRAIAREGITHLIAVSTLLTIIADDPSAITREAFPALEMVMTGAELCAPTVINLFKERLQTARVYNVYGPTEVTIVCIGHEITAAEPDRTAAYPIGLPLAGVEELLLDDFGNVVTTVDTPGELCLAGAQVMTGYLDDPLETEKRILVRDGRRYYRSGDQCTRDALGRLHFVGRKDSEIKLRGRRINLAEVQAECMALPGVGRAAVGLVAGPAGEQVVGAVLVSDSPDVLDMARARLAQRVPAYMLPRLWVRVPSHRLGNTGKTDDRSLLAQLEARSASTDPSIPSEEVAK